jgi:hypothetical protein
MRLRRGCSTLTPTAALVATLSATAVTAGPKLQGIYSNMEPSVGQGELIGMEVFILPYVEGSGDGEVAYTTALIQFADGLPARPQLVEADVQGQTIALSAIHPVFGELRFTGSIDGDGLSGHFDQLGEVTLPRGESISQWGSGDR